MPEEERPDIRPQLREFLAWYEKVLAPNHEVAHFIGL
jgi:hypothetical protein